MTSRKFKIKNWEIFQHYKDRNPPWIKLHFSLLSSEDWVTLDDASRLLAVVCMLIASKDEGRIPDNPAYIQRVGYLRETPNFYPLISCGFLEEVLAEASSTLASASTPLALARPEQRRGEKRERAQSAPLDPKSELFARGKEVLGKTSGGLIAKLLRSFGPEDDPKSIAKARARIEEASTKANPAEWLGRVMVPKQGDFKLMSGIEGVV